MAIESLELDLTSYWSGQESLFVNDQSDTKNAKEFKSSDLNLGIGHEWDTLEMDEFWKSLESKDFVDDLQINSEVMTNKVNCQDDGMDMSMSINETQYHASAFMSPLSMPSSSQPASPLSNLEDHLGEYMLQQSIATPFYEQKEQMQSQTGLEKEKNDDAFAFLDDFENTNALDILNELMESNAELASLDGSSLDGSFDSQNSPLSPEQEDVDVESEGEVEVITQQAKPAKRAYRKRTRLQLESDDDPVWEPTSDGSKVKCARKGKAKATPKRSRRLSISTDMRKERKKNQNKTAAERYRMKKRAEAMTNEVLENEQLEIRDDLRGKLEKLQMEFNVLLPIAQKAFASDVHRSYRLKMIERNVAKEHLLQIYN